MLGDPSDLLQLVSMKMPFGKYQGVTLVDLPESYVVWFKNKGFPPGDLGRLLGLLYEIKANGLEPLLEPFRTGKFPAHKVEIH